MLLVAEDSVSKEVSVSVDGAETRMIFVDHQDGEMSLENQLSTYCPDGFLVVFAVDDESSLTEAEKILNDIKLELGHKPCILVANKTDLVRNRIVRTTGTARTHFLQSDSWNVTDINIPLPSKCPDYKVTQ